MHIGSAGNDHSIERSVTALHRVFQIQSHNQTEILFISQCATITKSCFLQKDRHHHQSIICHSNTSCICPRGNTRAANILFGQYRDCPSTHHHAVATFTADTRRYPVDRERYWHYRVTSGRCSLTDILTDVSSACSQWIELGRFITSVSSEKRCSFLRSSIFHIFQPVHSENVFISLRA